VADDVFARNTGPGDRLNVAYSSSTVTKGRAKGIVFATGSITEIGAIASALQKKDSRVRPVKRKPNGHAGPHRYLEAYTLTLSDAIGRFLGVNIGTPLQRKLSKLAILLFGVAVVCAIICLGANRFDSRQDVVIYAVATGLSMIPASLVVVLTITMAAGTKRMVQRNVIVRNLKSLEALGAVTDICSDKTGTLTQGKMIARAAWIPSTGTFVVENSNEVFNPTQGDIRLDCRQPRNIDFENVREGLQRGSTASPPSQLLGDSDVQLREFLYVATLANLATINETDGKWVGRGDPTELAIQVFSRRFNWTRATLTQGEHATWTDIAELPFDSEVKRMSVVMKNNTTGTQHVFTKGAVERVIKDCTRYCPRDAGDEMVPVTDSFRAEVLRNMAAFASLGLRVLCLASRRYDGEIQAGQDIDRRSVEVDLTFRGLIGLYDPPRPESAPAVRECHKAGISVHMLTGDHPETAKAIAIEVGILPSRLDRVSRTMAEAMVMTATDFDALDDDQIDAMPVLPLVIARCAPSTKVRMIEALHRRKKFCAMVG
jgi:potassium/sodium efflux P-type ATPase